MDIILKQYYNIMHFEILSYRNEMSFQSRHPASAQERQPDGRRPNGWISVRDQQIGRAFGIGMAPVLFLYFEWRKCRCWKCKFSYREIKLPWHIFETVEEIRLCQSEDAHYFPFSAFIWDEMNAGIFLFLVRPWCVLCGHCIVSIEPMSLRVVLINHFD